MKILLLESQEADAQFMQTSLGVALAGVEISRARSVDAMLGMLATHCYDCLLLDCSLIARHGDDMLAGIVQRHSAQRPAVIMLSNRETDDYAARAMHAGAADVLNKAYCSSNLLVAVVRAACHDREKRIMEQRRRQRLAYLATHDAVSGLGNRAVWRQDLELRLKRCCISQQGFALHLVKIAGLEQLNLRMGRVHADQALRLLGQRMAGMAGKQQRFYRLDDDEFFVLQEHRHDAAWHRAWQEQLRSALSAPLMMGAQGPMIRMAVVIGGASYPDEGLTLDALMQQARRALARDARRSWRGLGWRRFMPVSEMRRVFEPLLEPGLA